MTDPTEDIRKQMLVEINAAPGSREYLEHKHGQVWDTAQLSEDFEVSASPPLSSSSAGRAMGRRGACVPGHHPGSTSDSRRTDRDTADKGRKDACPIIRRRVSPRK